MVSLLEQSLYLVVTWVEVDEAKLSKYAESLYENTDGISEQNMAVQLVERNVQCVWLKAGQKCFIGDIYSVTEASTTIANRLGL